MLTTFWLTVVLLSLILYAEEKCAVTNKGTRCTCYNVPVYDEDEVHSHESV